MLSGKLPFNGKNDDEIFDKILEMKVEFPEKEWKNIDKDAIDLIKKMLCNVSDRLNAQQVLNHAWVQKNAPNPDHPKMPKMDIIKGRNLSEVNRLLN